jgi:uncharacterized delta-60 repeat protein
MNQQLRRTIQRVLRAAPAVTLATGIVCPVALGDPGDLDPTFADVGRFVAPEGQGLNGDTRSIALQDDNFVFAGGEIVSYWYYYYSEHYTRGFGGRLTGDGTLDTGFDAPDLVNTRVIDAAMQSDGKLAGIGQRDEVYLAFRLERDGALDAGFGVDGIVELTGIEGVSSVAVDAADAIVIAGWQGADIKVIRLLANGGPDDSFGTAGVFTAAAEAADEEFWNMPQILVSEGGGYRVTDNDSDASVSRCRVLALTSTGAVDETFGDQGYAGLPSSSGVIGCNAIVEAPDGDLIVAGYEGSEPMVVRLVADGSVDGTFAANGLAGTPVLSVAAMGVDANDGSIAIAGYGQSDVMGFPVARLESGGALDTTFGNAGTTYVDMPGTVPSSPYLFDVNVLSNGDVLVAGGSSLSAFTHVPFVARLTGADGNDSPGVLGVRTPHLDVAEEDQAIVTVRRMGGKTGSVSVAYEAKSTSVDAFGATAEEDYAATTGRLEWADGDVGDKQIVVPIAPDGGSPEENEFFVVELNDAQGGAGLGTRTVLFTIASDAPDAGMFAIEGPDITVTENDGFAQLYVSRGYSQTGAVSVTVTIAADTATATDDFEAGTRTIQWADGDADWKQVDIPIVNDTDDEDAERFTVALSDPTGGAVIGPRSGVAVTITANDAPPPEPPPPTNGGGGGGGQLGFGSLLLLGMLRLLRMRR